MEQNNFRIAEGCTVKRSRIGSGSVIQNDCVVIHSEIGENVDIEKRNLIRNSVIGDMTYTGADTSIMWAEIGKFCCISRMADIGGNEHNYRAAAMMPAYRARNRLGGKLATHPDEEMIRVGHDVWIGQGVCIVRKPGLTVGTGAVIGAGAVVTRSIPPYAVAVGIPARVIKYRFPGETVEKLLDLKWWDWPKEKILRHWDLLESNLSEEILAELFKIKDEE